jgi:NAD(P)-dependent dehydrogenase (short-subunit alcohol dehydrogenase family)
MVAVVTGGSRGIGAAIVERFAQQGLPVACTATRVENAQPRAVAMAERYGVKIEPFELHVENAGEVRRVFDEIAERLGAPTVLVNNAGVTNVASILEADLDALSHVVDVNLKGILYCTQAAARLMVEGGSPAAIVNVGSVGGMNGFPNRGAYGATKAAVQHLTKVMAIELGQYGIRVNCVAPGFVETDMVKSLVAEGKIDIDALRRRTPLNRLLDADEIAEAVWWLTSNAARGITGECVLVDGGWTAYGHL